MPRGKNPNSLANLVKNSDLTPSQRREKASKAGKASAKARKEYATLTEALKDQCTPEVKQQLTEMLIKKAKAGNLKAYELLRDQMGEKPIDKVAVSAINDEAVDNLKDAIARRRNESHEG